MADIVVAVDGQGAGKVGAVAGWALPVSDNQSFGANVYNSSTASGDRTDTGS